MPSFSVIFRITSENGWSNTCYGLRLSSSPVPGLLEGLCRKGQKFPIQLHLKQYQIQVSTMEERKPSPMEKDLKKKKLSPSTLRRNARRREKFLKKQSSDDPGKEAHKHSDIEYNLKEALDNPIILK